MLMTVQITAEKKPKKKTADALWKVNSNTVSFQSTEMPKKVFGGFDNIFHVYLMRGFQKDGRN